MLRHKLNLFIICLSLSACAATSGHKNQKVNAQKAPMNVLMIAVDDLNDWVGVLGGHPQAETPNIDRLAKRGVLFSNAHTPSPVCNSARTSIMTGLLPSKTGIYRNGVRAKPFVDNHLTISEAFKNKGYYTAGAGKLLHLFYFKKDAWDVFENRYPDPKLKTGNHYQIGGTQMAVSQLPNELDAQTMDAKLASWVSTQLNQQHDKPFFIAAGIYRPHAPWSVPKRHFDHFPADQLVLPTVKADDLDDVGKTAFKWAMTGPNNKRDEAVRNVENSFHQEIVDQGDWNKGVQAYLASIRHADEQVGKILDALDASPYKDNTIVILWSDHGWHLGEKHHWRKSTLWEEATQVPFIILVPEMTKAQSKVSSAVSVIDVFPTLNELLELEANVEFSGQSLVPQLVNSQTRRETPAITEYYEGNVSARNERYRYIRYANGDEELYDHQNDPNEWYNLSNQAELAEIKAFLSSKIPTEFVPERQR